MVTKWPNSYLPTWKWKVVHGNWILERVSYTLPFFCGEERFQVSEPVDSQPQLDTLSWHAGKKTSKQTNKQTRAKTRTMPRREYHTRLANRSVPKTSSTGWYVLERFSIVTKVIHVCIEFVSLRIATDWKNARHFLKQSEANPINSDLLFPRIFPR